MEQQHHNSQPQFYTNHNPQKKKKQKSFRYHSLKNFFNFIFMGATFCVAHKIEFNHKMNKTCTPIEGAKYNMRIESTAKQSHTHTQKYYKIKRDRIE